MPGPAPHLLALLAAVLKQAIAWRLAQVKLKEAQGLLAAEAGYNIGICLADGCE